MLCLLLSPLTTLFLHRSIGLSPLTPSIFAQTFVQVPFPQWSLPSPSYLKVRPLPRLIFFTALITFKHTILLHCTSPPIRMQTPEGQKFLRFIPYCMCDASRNINSQYKLVERINSSYNRQLFTCLCVYMWILYKKFIRIWGKRLNFFFMYNYVLTFLQ